MINYNNQKLNTVEKTSFVCTSSTGKKSQFSMTLIKAKINTIAIVEK